jgi:hypothetical protein
VHGTRGTTVPEWPWRQRRTPRKAETASGRLRTTISATSVRHPHLRLTLAPGAYAVEWYGVDSRETTEGGTATVPSDGSVTFTPPFVRAGPTVLYLARQGH